MLTSTEEVYSDYLKQRVVADGVDATIVHAALRQMGFDQTTIAVMMGEIHVYSSPFTTTSSASSSTFASISSVKRPSLESGLSVVSHPSDPSAMADAAQFQCVISVSDQCAGDAPRVAPATATDSAPVLFSVDYGIERNTGIVRDAYVSAPSTTATAVSFIPPAASTTEPAPAPSRTVVAGAMVGAAGGFGVDSPTGAALSSPTRVELSVSRADAKEVSEAALVAPQSSPTPSEDTRASAAWHEKLSAADRDILVQWMREYQMLTLSSALSQQVSCSGLDLLPSSTALLLTQGAPLDEFRGIPSAAPSRARDDDVTYDEVGVNLGDEIAAKSPARRSVSTAPVSGKAEDSESLVASSDGATPSNCSVFIRADAVYHPFREPLSKDGADVAEKAQGEGAHMFSEGRCGSAARPLCQSAYTAAPGRMRRSALKTKSSTLVPTCGMSVSRGATGCLRCNFDVAQCRHPYREAQDVRIVRVSHVAVMGNGEYDHCAIPLSCSRARELDRARQAQQTARAETMCGRCVPVMHPPIGTSVQPKAGLANGRQTSTLPDKAKTDRVRLAQYYLRQWERQERRSSTAARGAAWDARYALLSCAGRTG
ncbi:hypothetical protein JKF63_00596 [Porcisia hertigi]|uniref:Uncharacterized protein n=1 Tax=Porcisia hertigi TaxID=2761500 RepID=A0A836KX80_9TRYP|nr:hypothetical protein JKF63_00596 [Porcisia hertigi]